jgi:hypothetical protein
MIRTTPAIMFTLASSAAFAANISCVGTMIDIDIDPRADFPYAAVYDEENGRTCMLNRGTARHDPLRGLCAVGQRCTIKGTYRTKIGNTYYLDFGRDAGIEGPR